MRRYVFIRAKRVFLALSRMVGPLSPLYPRLFLGLCLWVCLGVCLGACGPKSVGDDVSVALPSGGISPAHDPSQARYPMGSGYNTRSVDALLYHVNTPAYMQARQQRLDSFLRQNAAEHAPNDYTNLKPQQVSPFRE